MCTYYAVTASASARIPCKTLCGVNLRHATDVLHDCLQGAAALLQAITAVGPFNRAAASNTTLFASRLRCLNLYEVVQHIRA